MNDGEAHEDESEVLALYLLAVEMADRVSARRGVANTFYLAIQTVLVSVVGLLSTSSDDRPTYATVAVCVTGVLIAAAWWLQLRSYRDLNKAKYGVIQKIEDDLSIRIFTDEWETLRGEGAIPWMRGRYAELGSAERLVPLLFACVYLSIGGAVLWN